MYETNSNPWEVLETDLPANGNEASQLHFWSATDHEIAKRKCDAVVKVHRVIVMEQ